MRRRKDVKRMGRKSRLERVREACMKRIRKSREKILERCRKGIGRRAALRDVIRNELERTLYRISHSHLFNKLDIHITHMYMCISPLYLVTQSLIHKLTQAIMHTNITLEPQENESENPCRRTRRRRRRRKIQRSNL